MQNSLRDICSDASFRHFVSLLCHLSGKFDSKRAAVAVDMDFKGMRPQITFSSSSLDEIWAVRDVSRASFTTDGWQMRWLVRLHTEVHLHAYTSTDTVSPHYFETFGTHNLLLAGDEVTRTIFLGDDYESRSKTEILLASFKAGIASTYDWGGNEMTVNLAMALISSFCSRAETFDEGSAIAGAVMQLYRWTIKVVVNRELSSAYARIRVAKLLREVSKFDIEYGKEAKPECRAGMLLIKLFQDLDVRVKFELAEHSKSIFLQFPFVDRIHVYRDMVENLESDETCFEGFALRAYTLMQLAFASDDIRRAAMVNLLELGKFVSSKLIVHSCFKYIADRLYMGQLDALFLQNRSQFLYSWIDFEEDLFEFPFHVFGFSDFDSWSSSIKDELISQLVNAGRWDDASTVFKSNRFEDVLVSCLPRIISYFYLKDPPVSEQGNSLSADVPNQCKAALGADLYASILTSRFALSLAVIVERLDDKSVTAEALDSLGFGAASATFSAIGLPDPGSTYPEASQPSFAIRKVLTAIEYLQRALNVPPQQVWTTPNTVFVLRQLFNQGLATSDTTVAHSFLRRVAFVLCLAGDAICEGYPLEMLFFNVRNFLDRASIRQGAIQIIKYLFSCGTNYLAAHPDRLRYVVAVLLPSIQPLHAGANDVNFGAEVYNWLEAHLRTILPGQSNLRATTLLLELVNERYTAEVISAGQIVENVIVEDEGLWCGPDARYFALNLLSVKSNVFQEPLLTLRYLVTYFLSSAQITTYPAASKIWLGLALGRISRETNFLQPEYKSKQKSHEIKKLGDTEISSTNAVVEHMLRFMRIDSTIAGMLEQALREVLSTSTFRIPQRFGVDQVIVKYLSSPYLESNPCFHPSLILPPPSNIDAWTILNRTFTTWFKSLACSIAQHLQNPLFKSIVTSIDASMEFCRTIFPYLIDEYRSQKGYDGSITEIFNTILRIADTVDQGYSRLIIQIILFLRDHTPKAKTYKYQPLVDEIDYLHAANAAVACKMYKTGLMFLELSGKQESRSTQLLAERIISEIYRNVDDPDMTYALSKSINRSWNQLLEVYTLHHDRERVNGLRRARLRGKVELGINPSFEDEDFRAVTDQIRANGFPLKAEGIALPSDTNENGESSINLYKSAWRLGNWDLPPLAGSEETDTLIYTVLFHLGQTTAPETFFSILDSAIIQVVEGLFLGLNSAGYARASLCLSMFADITDLFSNSQSMSVSGRRWIRQILQNARFGR